MTDAAQLWTELARHPADPRAVKAAHLALRSDPPFAVCLAVLERFPAYLATIGEQVLAEFLHEHAPQIDAAVLERIGQVFVAHWRSPPRDVFWYGDLRQSFGCYEIQQRLATVAAVEDQLLDDLRTLVPGQRERADDLVCRRLERACEVLVQAPSERCRATLSPLVALDYIDPIRKRPMSWRYEDVYWGMLRILRKLGERI
ncbi:MAG: hypothetical protein AB7P03_21360 [Kofleriaceae bacterium]